MKLLIYSHDWAPSIGGIQTIVMNLARGLATWSHAHSGGEQMDVTVVTPTPASEMNDAELPFRVIRKPSAYQLFELIRTSDVIHCAGPTLLPMLFGWACGKAVVVEHSGYQAICPNGILIYGPTGDVCPGRFMKRGYLACIRCNAPRIGWTESLRSTVLTFPRRWLCGRIARNVAPSHHVAQRINLPQTDVIFHGVKRPESERAARPATILAGEPPFFAYVGRLVTEKGLPILLEASSKLLQAGHSFRLKIVGDGPERDSLTETAKTKGLLEIVEFTGALPAEKVSDAVVNAVAVIMPSVWEEVAGLTALEQMMRGNLLIASKIGGLGEFVKDGGLTFPPGNADALALRMRQALDDPQLTQMLKIRAGERARELFTEERMLSQHAHLYGEIIPRAVKS